ncbi:hypothetical protein JCM17380_11940 [Desulfosporosinus burensis]
MTGRMPNDTYKTRSPSTGSNDISMTWLIFKQQYCPIYSHKVHIINVEGT